MTNAKQKSRKMTVMRGQSSRCTSGIAELTRTTARRSFGGEYDVSQLVVAIAVVQHATTYMCVAFIYQEEKSGGNATTTTTARDLNPGCRSMVLV